MYGTRVRDDSYEYDRLLRRHKQERIKDDKYNYNDIRGDYRQESDVYYSLCLHGLNQRVPHDVLKDGISKEFEKFGDFTVKVVNNPDNRIAFVNFSDHNQARQAKYARKNFMLFDSEVRVEPAYPRNKNRSSNGNGYYNKEYYNNKGSYRTSDREYYNQQPDKYNNQSQSGYNDKGRDQGNPQNHNHKFPYHLHHVPPEDDKHATRTLFVGNLDVSIREEDLRGIFDRYGTIEEIDIKRPPVPGKGNAYAFIKYFNVDMAHRAKCDMSGRYIGMYECKIGYGKAHPTNCLWIGGLGPWVHPEVLEREFDRFGVIERIEWPNGKAYAYVLFGTVDAASAANSQMRGARLGNSDKRIRIDFADENHMPTKSQSRDYLPPDAIKPSAPAYDAPRDYARSSEYRSARGDRSDAHARTEDAHRTSKSESESHDNRRRSRNAGAGDDRSHKSYDARAPPPDSGESRSKRMRTTSPDRTSNRTGERGSRLSESNMGDAGRRGDDSASLGALDTSVDLQTVETIVNMSRALPIVWSGALVLKASAFSSRMHLVNGNVRLVDTLMRDHTSTEMVQLKITQRLRMERGRLDEISRRVSGSDDDAYAVLLAMAVPDTSNTATTAMTADDSLEGGATQNRPLRNLVTYLRQKEAAGVIALPPIPSRDKNNVGVLYAFPPSDFGLEFLTKRAPNLENEMLKDDHLLVVVLRGAA